MLNPAEHPDEMKRLEALRELEPIGTGSDPLFDDLTLLAQKICKAPISLMGFVDHDRQWNKSARGLDIRDIPRPVSFCAHTILRPGIFEIRDARKDADFHDHPWVIDGPRIRFYAGVPVFSRSGLPVGSLCVMDSEPGHLDP